MMRFKESTIGGTETDWFNITQGSCLINKTNFAGFSNISELLHTRPDDINLQVK